MSGDRTHNLTGWTEPVAGVKKFGTVTNVPVVQSITAAGAINTDADRVNITGPGSSTYAVTLAAPDADHYGKTLCLYMVSTTSTNAVTLALTNVTGGSGTESASFDAAGEEMMLVAGVGKWFVVGEAGVTLTGS